SEYEATGPLWVRDREIDAKARRTNLALHVIAECLQALADIDLEFALEVLAADLTEPEVASLGKRQKELERCNAASASALEIKVSSRKIGENLAAELRATDKDIQASLSTLAA